VLSGWVQTSRPQSNKRCRRLVNVFNNVTFVNCSAGLGTFRDVPTGWEVIAFRLAPFAFRKTLKRILR